jgi:uncharacterized SAM-binding protein YcdF (DUF218 family)
MNLLTTFFLGIILSPILVLGTTFYQVNFFESGWQEKTAGDCLMVLGSKVLSSNVPDLMMRERVATAEQFITPDIRHVILTGGTVDEKIAEAEMMKALLLEKGFDEDRFLLEKKSTSTYENLVMSKPLIEAGACEKLDVLSHDFHLARVKMTADRLDIPINRFIPAEIVKPNTKERISREYMAYLWYWFGWAWMEG